jgi:uncharacterized repeat protein (TIGR03803 family)
MEEEMKSGRFSHSMSRVMTILTVAAMLVTAASSASTVKVLYSFSDGNDGGYPDSDLVADSAGNLYGTTVEGGAFGSGTVFKLAPSGNSWIQTVLYSFTSGADGGQPYGGVTLDAQGNLYGTAVVGGTFTGSNCVDFGCGVVFKLTKSGGNYSPSVIHSFAGGNDGYGPGAGVTFDKNGNLYGMTPTGGADGLGVIYELRPGPNGTWTETVAHTFTGGDDGASGSAGRMILDSAGNLYGVATTGGRNGDGVVFEFSPSQAVSFKTLYAFQGQPDAGYPYAALTFDPSGNLYGATYYDGANGFGAIYKLTQTNGIWSESVLYSFKGGADGQYSLGNLIFDAKGNLYGTTSEGGSGCSCGVIFKLTPSGKQNWTESVPYRFKGIPDAGFVYNGMVTDGAGSFYGTSVHGGTSDEGSIFKFTP